MARRYRTLIVLGVAVGALTFPFSAQAGLNGKYLQGCRLANVAQVDPLVSPGGVSGHNHAQVGGTAWSATSTPGDLLAGPTTCHLTANHAAYWVPTMVMSDGTHIPPTSGGGYYLAANADPALIAGGKIQPYAFGTRFLVGNPASVGQQPGVVKWRCNRAGQPTKATLSGIYPCPEGVGIELLFFGPRCWDGLNLDSQNHKAHMSAGISGGVGGNGCDTEHPVRIPQLEWSFIWPASAIGGRLSSDQPSAPAGSSAHMDLIEAQDPIAQAELTKCLNDPARDSVSSPLCGLFTWPETTFLPPLLTWANKVSYVKPDGNPGLPPAN